jgi:hypothetical protein
MTSAGLLASPRLRGSANRHASGYPNRVDLFGSFWIYWRPARQRLASRFQPRPRFRVPARNPSTAAPASTPDPHSDPAHSLRLRRPTPAHPSPIPLAENEPEAPGRPRQLSKVQSAEYSGQRKPPHFWGGKPPLRLALRPERRSSVTIYKAVPSRFCCRLGPVRTRDMSTRR